MSVLSFQAASNPITLWIEYCQARGLTDEILAPVNGELLTLEKASKVVGTGIFGFKQVGAVGAYVFPLAKDEYQARLIYDPDRVDPIPKPGEDVKPPKLPKYYRQKNAANVLYIPPHLTDWYNPQSEYDLLIVEGALNAVRLAAAGYHATGITGVFNYRTGNKHTPIIPEIVRLVQAKHVKRIIVMFDSDTGDPDEKRDLWNGIHNFSQDLMKLRPDRKDTIFICRPPPKLNGSKNGPDDYLHEKGPDEFNRLLREESQQYSSHPYLQIEAKCLDRFIYDEDSGMFFDCEIRRLIKAEHANRTMMTFGAVDDILSARPKKMVYSTDRLLQCELVRKAHGEQFNPGTDAVFFQDSLIDPPLWRINKFSPLDVPKSIKGDVSIFFRMLDSICRDSPSAIQKLLTIAAYHAQNPALTPKYGILLAGEQGSGKSLMVRAIGRALSNRYHCARVNLSVDFNSDWRGYACKEWAEFDKNMDEEWLKDLITGESYAVSVKYGTNYTERNHTLNIFTCNGLQSKLQTGDRRFVIAGYARPDDKLLGLEFEKWINGPGPNYLRYYLLNEVDASAYDIMDVRTELRDAVIDASQSYKATVKDYIMEELEQVEGLECLPNNILEILLKPHGVNTISFMKQFGQYFVKPNLELVKVNGIATRFRAFKNHEKWKVESNSEAYREQYKLAERLVNLGSKF